MYCSRPASLALVGLFIWLTGCTSYKQIQLSEVSDYGKVRVTQTDGEREEALQVAPLARLPPRVSVTDNELDVI